MYNQAARGLYTWRRAPSKHQPANPAPLNLPATGFVRMAELLRFIPFSKATVWRKVKAKEFPKPVKLSAQVTAWKVEDVRAWIEAQG